VRRSRRRPRLRGRVSGQTASAAAGRASGARCRRSKFAGAPLVSTASCRPPPSATVKRRYSIHVGNQVSHKPNGTLIGTSEANANYDGRHGGESEIPTPSSFTKVDYPQVPMERFRVRAYTSGSARQSSVRNDVSLQEAPHTHPFGGHRHHTAVHRSIIKIFNHRFNLLAKRLNRSFLQLGVFFWPYQP
jgi:hypothetical protein